MIHANLPPVVFENDYSFFYLWFIFFHHSTRQCTWYLAGKMKTEPLSLGHGSPLHSKEPPSCIRYLVRVARVVVSTACCMTKNANYSAVVLLEANPRKERGAHREETIMTKRKPQHTAIVQQERRQHGLSARKHCCCVSVGQHSYSEYWLYRRSRLKRASFPDHLLTCVVPGDNAAHR